MKSMVFRLFGDRLGLLHLRDCGRGGVQSVFGEDYVLEFCGGTYFEI